ncbi:Hypothetical lipoprotein precursor [Flavobacterium indicum GPTSA100-9 = DSM 17447]|uniref:Hypothetical lipoprotein n=1 Tax=Flavobacterium indicum (strain DSM 17447 / CIP 109464 / GPTSA100-9) TaxID=1094466 RepID=H8XNH9_FLAIG|nr:hypothetical protein [Flavobacterium indicum]CCG52096.1 Hypothetical lipoprotein precursor [Flavobacterium indicum GPTSA100-9 = DSM 17447]
MKLKFLLLVFFFFLFSCNQENKSYSNKNIDKINHILQKGNLYQKGQIRNFIVFVKTDNMIAKTDIEYLEFLYSKYYNTEFPIFKNYLEKALNNDLIFKSEFFKSFDGVLFVFNDSFFKNYSISNFNEFVDKYCYSNDEDICIKNELLKTNKQVLEFAYYLNLNGYYMEKFDLNDKKCVEKIEKAINFKVGNLNYFPN